MDIKLVFGDELRRRRVAAADMDSLVSCARECFPELAGRAVSVVRVPRENEKVSLFRVALIEEKKVVSANAPLPPVELSEQDVRSVVQAAIATPQVQKIVEEMLFEAAMKKFSDMQQEASRKEAEEQRRRVEEEEQKRRAEQEEQRRRAEEEERCRREQEERKRRAEEEEQLRKQQEQLRIETERRREEEERRRLEEERRRAEEERRRIEEVRRTTEEARRLIEEERLREEKRIADQRRAEEEEADRKLAQELADREMNKDSMRCRPVKQAPQEMDEKSTVVSAVLEMGFEDSKRIAQLYDIHGNNLDVIIQNLLQ